MSEHRGAPEGAEASTKREPTADSGDRSVPRTGSSGPEMTTQESEGGVPSLFMQRLGKGLLRNSLVIVLVLVAVAFSIMNPAFASLQNMVTLGIELSAIALITFGQTGVLLTAGIDLSVGNIIGLAGVVGALALVAGQSFPVAFLMAACTGVVVGMVNGLLVAYLNIPAFIVTLGTGSATLSMAYILSAGEPVMSANGAFLALTTQSILGVPIVAWLMLIIFLLWWLILERTPFGTYVYAIGGNPMAARLAGVNTRKITMIVYIVSGLLAAVAGMIMASEATAGIATTGSSQTLTSIAGAVIGGVSLFGGRGRLWGAAVGVLLITVLINGMAVLNVSEFYQGLASGTLIILAVFMDALYRRLYGES